MKLKTLPEDFAVRERYDLRGVGADGPFLYLRVEKRRLSTPEAAARVAAAAGVQPDAVRFAGLKDRRAITTQIFSVEGAAPFEIDDEDLRAEGIGWSAHPVRADRIEGNDFEIVARDLDDAELERLRRGVDAVRAHGLPSYFDDQRFGAARAGKGFPAREMIRGRADEALRLLIATPSVLDPPAHAERKAKLAAAWGRWTECLALAQGVQEEGAFRHLRDHDGDFLGALRFVSRRERLFQLFAYQSLLWNRALDRLVRARVPPDRLVSIESESGALAAWRSLEAGEAARFSATDLRLPDHRTRSDDAEVAVALEAACAEDGLRVADLRIPKLRGFQFREECRACVLRPERLEVGAPEPDELHPGRRKASVTLSLPRGAYATLVVKRAVA
ncbi:MAG TPA: tRNA pseudouridine(13) synthase TruD [Planctomycetota bacterium]|nr:tRNA pseudouridine(13) synthase TruD [Planctomycetota bacterium]